MAEKNVDLAKHTYKTLLEAVRANGWTCNQNVEKLSINYELSGDAFHMDFVVFIDAERQLVRLLSPLPFKFSTDKMLDGALATCGANFALADGSFDYNITNGEIIFRMTTCYNEIKLSKEALIYILNYSAWAVSKYNNSLLSVAKGEMSAEEFNEKYAK